ncbi:MAG: hypothetical protein AAGM67_10715, partial [Bacteroidota bacterium]
MQELCGNGFDPYQGIPKGFYGEFGFAPSGNGDDEMFVWNVGSCNDNNDGTPEQGSLLPFACCRGGELEEEVTAHCPVGLTTLKLPDGEVCVSSLQPASNMPTAIAKCQGMKGHVCTHSEMQQVCSIGNPYQGAVIGWYGDHGIATGGNWDDEYMIWNRNTCDPNNDGIA